MNNPDYYSEIERKSYEFEHFGNTNVKGNNSENTEDNLLNDYELVTNDDLHESAADFSNPASVTNPEKPMEYMKNSNNKSNLSITLDIEKIALKSQSAKIDKSVIQELGKTKESKEPAPAIHSAAIPPHRRQRTPLAFTIVPIDVARSKAGNEHCTFSAKTMSATTKKMASVSFCTALERAQFTNDVTQQSRAATTVHSSILPISMGEINIAKTKETPETHLRCESSYDDNEINSQPGSSTSPESYVDHILSAASSASMRSSSISSSTELAHFLGDGGRDMLGGARRTSAAITTGQATLESDVAAGSRKTQLCLKSLNLNHNMQENKMAKLREKVLSSPLALADARDVNGDRLKQHLVAHQHQSVSPTMRALQSTAGDASETISNFSRSSSPTQKTLVRDTPVLSAYPEDLKCTICSEVFRDPRVLNCLHSFCFKCLVDENFKQDNSILFWSQPGAEHDMDWKASAVSNSLKSSKESSPELRLNNISDGSFTPPQRSSFSFRRKKSIEKPYIKVRIKKFRHKLTGHSLQQSKSDGQASSTSSSADLQKQFHYGPSKTRRIICRTCSFATAMPLGGLCQLPQNQLLVRKIDKFKLKITDDIITRIWCSLCFEETNAFYHCVTCMLNLCTLCKEAHERQRNTTNHSIQNILDLRRAKNKKQNGFSDKQRQSLKCGMHPGFEMNSFCTICLQLACSDCLVLVHKGHKHESISKASIKYAKILSQSTEQTRSLGFFAQHSIDRLNAMAKKINAKCDAIQAEVEDFMSQYSDAVEVHRKTLLQQVQRARESKVETILEQQLNLEKRSAQVLEVLRFSQELTDSGSDVELLSLVSILLKRLEFCSQLKSPQDQKISESLHFLPHIRAPSTKTQNNIPLFGIITVQTVEPALCSLDTETVTHLRLHKKVELMMQARDADGAALCHGGLQLKAQLKYKEYISKTLPVETSDHRDGTYGIAFIPDMQGTILLTVTIDNKPIKGSPFTFLARAVRPHNGIYHCCAFCSSKGSKSARCCCQGRMPGYNGCGHGHAGHPGRRHWSCCGNVLENSECSMTNKLLNAE